MNKDVTKKWEETGLLQGLSVESKEITAKGLDNLAFLLVGESGENIRELGKETLVNTTFAVYRRFVSSGVFPSKYKLYNHYKNWLNDKLKNVNELSEDQEFDLVGEYMTFIKMHLNEVV
jgi:hypothetical protein